MANETFLEKLLRNSKRLLGYFKKAVSWLDSILAVLDSFKKDDD